MPGIASWTFIGARFGTPFMLLGLISFQALKKFTTKITHGMEMDKVFIGVPVFGAQPRSFWLPLARECAHLHEQGIQLVNLFAAESMMTDVNRNYIVKEFLKSGADWLKWLDADNVDHIHSIRRLLDTHKTLVTGVYVKRQDKAEPVVYTKTLAGNYVTMADYVPGQIRPVAAAGLGGCLVHRSVFEDIPKNYRMFDQVPGGGVTLIHKDDIIGDVFDDATHEHDWKVVDGVQHRRLRVPKEEKPFSYFILKDWRTEDLGFFECAARSGHQLWCDTGVEIGHIGEKIYNPRDWKRWQRGQK